jgi:hypothetical protein
MRRGRIGVVLGAVKKLRGLNPTALQLQGRLILEAKSRARFLECKIKALHRRNFATDEEEQAVGQPADRMDQSIHEPLRGQIFFHRFLIEFDSHAGPIRQRYVAVPIDEQWFSDQFVHERMSREYCLRH